MSSKRASLAHLLEWTKVFDLLSRSNDPLFIAIAYHRIYETKLVTDFDEGVFGHSKTAFIEQMQWLQKNFDLIDQDQLIACINAGESFPSRTAFITFDDGYHDNFEIAYPVLKEMGIPATFFISCNHIDGKAFSWWDQIAFMIKRSENSTIRTSGIEISLPENSKERNDEISKVLAYFKGLSVEKVDQQLTELSEACGVPVPNDASIKSQFMSWEQIREISENGISIGSHSMNHQVLANLPRSQQEWEIRESKNLLESKIEQQVKTFAYPVGGVSSFTEETMDLTKKHGYELGFSFIQGHYKSTIHDKYQIRRVKLHEELPMCKAQTLLPQLFLKSQ